MQRALKYIGFALFLPIWWLQLLFPRRSSIWVFGAWYGKKYSDNSRYLFEYILAHQPEIRAIWITKSNAIQEHLCKNGIECYMANSWQGRYYCLMAKFVIVSSVKKDVNALWINGARTIQLWHGNPMKKIGLDDRYSEVNHLFYRVVVRHVFSMAYEFDYDYVVSNAPIFTEKMISAFDIPAERVLETGCPRNDVFFKTEAAPENTRIREQFPGSLLLYYLPTFRDNSGTQSLLDLDSFDEGELHHFLVKENMVFVTKAHFAARPVTESQEPHDRIVHLKDDILVDINDLLKDADILITDYSGAYFDFLLLQRPIIFAAFDLQQYLSSSRELYFDYEEVVAGPIVTSWDELFSELSNLKQSTLNYDLLLKEKNNIFNKFHDDENSRRVYEAIKKLEV